MHISAVLAHALVTDLLLFILADLHIDSQELCNKVTTGVSIATFVGGLSIGLVILLIFLVVQKSRNRQTKAKCVSLGQRVLPPVPG